MKITLLVVVALLAGSLLSLQAAINTQLAKAVGGPVLAAFTSFFIGTLVLFLVLVMRGELSLQFVSKAIDAPAWLYIGGALGAVYVTATIVLLPKIGVTASVLAIVCGQIIMSLTLDHFGAFGMPVRPLTMLRIGGAALVVMGLSLVFLPNGQQ